MELILSIVYCSLLFLTVSTLLLRPKWFLISFLLLMTVSPSAQYLVYEGVGENYFTTTYQRLSLEFINVFLLIFYILYHKVSFQKLGGAGAVFILLLFIWNILHGPTIVNAIDINRSLIFYIVSVLGPSIFLCFIVFSKSVSINAIKISRTIYLFSSFFLTLGVAFVAYRIAKEGFLNVNLRTAGSIYMSNAAINIMALFVPLIFIPHVENDKITKIQKNIFIVGILLCQLVATSRIGMVIYLLFFLRLRMTSTVVFLKSIIVLLGALIVMYFAVLEYYKIDLIELLIFRFIGYEESFSENTSNDERFRIWGETVDYIMANPSVLFTGIGVSNYRLANPELLTYSNAHNLFLNVLFERGITLFVVLLLKITSVFYIIRGVRKNFHLLSSDDVYLVRSLSYGIYMFLIIEFFYNDLFIASGQQCGFYAYAFYFNIAILLKYYLVILGLKNEKTG